MPRLPEMTPQRPGRLLIVGGSSFIGRHLMTAFGGRTVGTSIRGGNQLHSFDLASDDLTPILTSLGPFSHAMLLGAVATPDACFEDPDHSRRVNVDGMIRGIKTLQKFNIKPIFTSTEAVFDGQVGPYTETDIPKPIVAYGQQNVRSRCSEQHARSDCCPHRTSFFQ